MERVHARLGGDLGHLCSGSTACLRRCLAEGSRGAGLRAYGPDGEERFHLIGDKQLGWVETAWPYAYVHNGRDGKQFAVVDLRSGRVVATPRSSRQITILG